MAADFLSAIERYKPYLSPSEYDLLISASEETAAVTVRVNHLKVPDWTTSLKAWSERYGWKTEFLPFSFDALAVHSWQISPSQTVEHRFGYYYLQDAASLLPVALFDPQKTADLVLDMAASPGGKTTQLVDARLDQGLVLANDSSASRLGALRTVLQLWGASNVAVMNYPGEKWGDWYPETFDRVLLDAPCSMESLRRSSTHPHRPITEDERSRLASRQLALLSSAIKAVKVGGEVVYSTCTLAPEEDEQVLDGLLKLFPHSVVVAPLPANLALSNALTRFNGIDFNPQVANSLRVWPFTFGTNGFFAAKLIKSGSVESQHLAPPRRDFSATGFVPLTPSRSLEIKSAASDTYGFDFDLACQSLGLVLYQREKTLFMLPEAYLAHFSNLPYHALGMPLAKVIGSSLEFTVEFIARFFNQFTRNIWTLPEDQKTQWLTGADLRGLEVPGGLPGSVIAVQDLNGVNLGAGKLNPGRIRNLLPNRNIRAW